MCTRFLVYRKSPHTSTLTRSLVSSDYFQWKSFRMLMRKIFARCHRWLNSFFSSSLSPSLSLFFSYCRRLFQLCLCVCFFILAVGQTITIVNSLQTFIIRSCRSFVCVYLYYKYILAKTRIGTTKHKHTPWLALALNAYNMRFIIFDSWGGGGGGVIMVWCDTERLLAASIKLAYLRTNSSSSSSKTHSKANSTYARLSFCYNGNFVDDDT